MDVNNLDDSKIIDLYWERSETAIIETSKKYSRYCRSISYNILHNDEDSEECVNDTYLRAWNVMPPKRPNCLATFLGKITRNLSLDKYKQYNAEKRGFGQTEIVLSELDGIVPSASSVERVIEESEIETALNRFLESLPKQKRIFFIRRYWYLMPVKEIAEQANESESQVKSMLFHTRSALKTFLEKEGITI